MYFFSVRFFCVGQNAACSKRTGCGGEREDVVGSSRISQRGAYVQHTRVSIEGKKGQKKNRTESIETLGKKETILRALS
jgi:hypothetical protein